MPISVLVEVSITEAAGPGAVSIQSEVGEVVALRVPRAGAQLTTTAVTFIGGDGGPFRARDTGRLYLGINDDVLTDNSGNLRVTVSY